MNTENQLRLALISVITDHATSAGYHRREIDGRLTAAGLLQRGKKLGDMSRAALERVDNRKHDLFPASPIPPPPPAPPSPEEQVTAIIAAVASLGLRLDALEASQPARTNPPLG